MKNPIIVSIVIAGMTVAHLSSVAQTTYIKPDQTTVTGRPMNSSAAYLKYNMRILWEDQIVLTHNVILCIVGNQPGIDEARDQLVKNQAAIGKIVAHYYGEETGKKLTKLLYKNAMITADIMIATSKRDKEAHTKAYNAWKENTYETLVLFDQVNPNWNLNDLKDMMYEQARYTANEAVEIKNDNFDTSTEAYNNAILMADAFTAGIIKQFPSNFTSLGEVSLK